MKIQKSKTEEWLDLDFDLINKLRIGGFNPTNQHKQSTENSLNF